MLVDGFPINDPLTGRADLSGSRAGKSPRSRSCPEPRRCGLAAGPWPACSWWRPGVDVRPEGSAWAASHGALGARLAARRAGSRRARRASAGGGLPLHGAGRAAAAENPAAERRRRAVPAALTMTGRWSWCCAARSPIAACRGPPPTRRPTRTGRTGRCCSAHAGRAVPTRIPPMDRDPGPGSRAPDRRGLRQLHPRDRRHAGAGPALAGVRRPLGGGGRFRGGSSRLPVRGGRGTIRLLLHPGGAARRARCDPGGVERRPGRRLDVWTGSTTPRASARLDAGWLHGRTSAHLGVGSAVTPPVLADLFFREGVGVRLNPDLRPERVRWEVEGGVRRELAGGITVGLRLFAGRVADMIVWAPDFRFIWSPRNFDVLRRGGEIRRRAARRDAAMDGTPRTRGDVRHPLRRPGAVPATGHLCRCRSVVARRLDRGPRWHRIGRRFPNGAGTNPRAAFSLLDAGLERRLGGGLALRGEVRDLADARAEFIAGYPTPGRISTFTLNCGTMIRLRSSWPLRPRRCSRSAAPTPTRRSRAHGSAARVNSTANTLSIVPVDNPGRDRCRSAARPRRRWGSRARSIAIVPLGLDNAVAVVDLLSATVARIIPLPANSGATGSAIVDDSIAYVGNPNLNTVSRVNYQTGVTRRSRWARFPQGLIFTRGKVFVLNGNLDELRARGAELDHRHRSGHQRAGRRRRLDSAHRPGQRRLRRGRLGRAALRHEHRRLLLGRGAAVGGGSRWPAPSSRATPGSGPAPATSPRTAAPTFRELVQRGRHGVRPRQQQGGSRRRARACRSRPTPPWRRTARAGCMPSRAGRARAASRAWRTCSTPP